MKKKILIIDFGSQYSQLIARRVREMEVFCEIIHSSKIMNVIEEERENILGVILSGGPESVYEENSPSVEKALFSQNIPVLGICYGMQLITHLHEGTVERAESREFGKASLEILETENLLFENVKQHSQIWMSHGDHITKLPDGFRVIAQTATSVAAIMNDSNIFALQFHPEVSHSIFGKEILENFIFKICKCEKNWKVKSFIEEQTKKIKDTVKDDKVILGLSGGVDSSVAAVLINNAIGKQLTCIFVDTGLLRKDEAKKVLNITKNIFP